MPADFIKVPHYPQSNSGACLPACVRMVLAQLGQNFSEGRLAEVLASYEFGTPASHVTKLSKLGYTVTYDALSFAEIEAALRQGHFPIAFVRADFLPWSNFTGFHAVVVVGVEGEMVYLHDPAENEGYSPIERDGFLMAWEEFDAKAAIISLKP